MKMIAVWIVFFGLASVTITQQQARSPSRVTGGRNSIPVSILKDLSKINTTSEFIKKYLVRDSAGKPQERPGAGRPDDSEPDIEVPDDELEINRNLSSKFENDVFAGPGSIDDSGASLADGYIGMPSEGCRPKVKTVPLSRYGKSTFMYWPDCVMLDQCSGCCTSDLLECQPVFTLIHPINAVVMEYNWTSENFMYRGIKQFEMEQHVECDCQCKIKEYNCNPVKHEYIPNRCSCRCLNENKASLCTSLQKWDDYMCECVCQKIITCPRNEYFHKGSCRCVKADGADVSEQEVNPCANTECRAHKAAVWRDGVCVCEQSDEWGDHRAGSIDIDEEIQTSSTTTVRPLRRPRPTRRRSRPRPSRIRARRDIADTDEEVWIN